MKKIVFMGTPQFSVSILESLIANTDYEVVAVFTQPDRPVGRKKIMTPSPVKEVAVAHHIPVFQPEKLSHSQELEWLLQQDIDLLVTAAYGQFLPEALLHHPTYRCVNVHASLLPKYRGGAPIQYALMNGDEKTGVTIMYMAKKMDAGDIISQRALPIEESDNVATLFEKLSVLGTALLSDTLPALFNGTITPVPQNEDEVTFSPAITREEEIIDWQKDAQQIHNQVRAMNSWPGAYTLWDGNRLKIWVSHVVDATHTVAPGNVVTKTKDTVVVACGQQTCLALQEVQPAGKQNMTIQAFCQGVGNKLQVGDQFGA